jgi:hypothetical protein
VYGVLGDGFMVGQTSEPEEDRWTESPPGRLVRTDLRTGAVVTGPLLSSRSYVLDLSPDGRTLVTAHGPVRAWDVSTGIRLLHSFADPHRGPSQTSGAWDDDGRYVLLEFPLELDEPNPSLRGRFHALDPTRGTFTTLPGWARNSNDTLGLATRGGLFTWEPYAFRDEEAGLRSFDIATNRWSTFAPATLDGSIELVDAVR